MAKTNGSIFDDLEWQESYREYERYVMKHTTSDIPSKTKKRLAPHQPPHEQIDRADRVKKLKMLIEDQKKMIIKQIFHIIKI